MVLTEQDVQRIAQAVADRLAAMPASQVLTVTAVADRLEASERFVLDELRRKKLRGAKTGAGWRIKAADLDTYLEARMNLARLRGR